MAQPQSQIPPPAFSPTKHSTSPAPSPHANYALPPNKRVRTDGPASQPASPYAGSPYSAASPAQAGLSPVNTGSPTQISPAPLGGTVAPLANGGATSATLSLPEAPPATAAAVQVPQPSPTVSATQNTAAMSLPASPAVTSHSMGPPQRPAERPSKDYEYDVTDSLAGTGIDLRAEEQYMSELYSNVLDVGSDSRTANLQHPAGSKPATHGAGRGSQASDPTANQSQHQATAEQAWADSAMRLAAKRTQEFNDPFLHVALLHRRADKIARDHHLGLNTDLKTASQSSGKARLSEQQATPTITVRLESRPETGAVQLTASHIPHDSQLVDQLALLSIATKQRLRQLVEEAGTLAANRQRTSHGDVPEEWAVAAAPMNIDPLEPMEETAAKGTAATAGAGGPDSGSNPLKCSADSAGLEDSPRPAKKQAKIVSNLTISMREKARQEREWEEARLRKRQRRKDGGAGSATSGTRSGSATPGASASAAPEPEKAMSKKELKKNQALRAAEANSRANQNLTSSMFAGLGGKGGLFGKKKTGRTYDWMNVGRTGTGAQTPTRAAGGPGKGPNGAAGADVAGGPMALTTEGRNRLGTWREDKERGRKIQLRDWVNVLERDGRESRALSHAYAQLDSSQPR